MRILKSVLFVSLLLPLQFPTAYGSDSDWAFVWVSCGFGGYRTSQGKASVRILKGKLVAEMADEAGIRFRLTGSIVKKRVNAKFTVIGSDYFIGSPFSGSYHVRRWTAVADSRGRESITLTDGWNFIGLSREIR